MQRLQTPFWTIAGRYFGPLAWTLALAAAVPAGATTLTVTSSADDVTLNHTLRYAVAHAQNGDTIQLTAAIKAPIVLTHGDIVVSNNVTILSVSARTPTISGGNSSRIFEISGATVTLSNLNFTAGSGICNNPNGDANWDGYGGVVLVDDGGALSVNSCSFTQNQCSQGGAAIELVGNSLTIKKSSFAEGVAFYGSAIDDENASGTDTMSISDCEFVNNTAAGSDAYGGVLTPFYGTYTISNCDFRDNFVSDDSLNELSGYYGYGAIVNSGGTMTVTGCTLENNSATDGGAIANTDGAMTISNCTLENNSANDGGAIDNEGSMTITNCALLNNSATAGVGGAIVAGGGIIITDCILSGNSATGGSFFTGAGGAICTVSRIWASNCTLSGNSATVGGAIFNFDLNGPSSNLVSLTGCILVNNNSATYGGGIYNAGTATVTWCTLSDNAATIDGGGIYNVGPYYGMYNFLPTAPWLDPPQLSIGTSAFSGNTPDAIAEPAEYTWYNLGRNIFH